MKDVHVSGYHDATPEEWAAIFVTVDRIAAGLVAATECRDDVAPNGWVQYRPEGVPGAECSLFHHPDQWTQAIPAMDHRGALGLTDLTFYTGQGAARPGVVATWALYAAVRRDWRLLRVVAHFPASVQNGDRFSRKTRRVAAWVDALRGLRREVRRLRRQLEPAEITVSCDWNVDLTRRHWRTVIRLGLAGTGLHLVPPGEGTHGKRAIDAHATTMRRQAVHVLRPFAGFDHRPVGAVLNRTKENHR